MRSLVYIAALVGAAVLAPTASGHPLFQPPFVSQGAAAELTLVAPNERKVGMTSIELTAPDSVELLAAHSPSAWHGAVDGSRASWSGGPLPAGVSGWFPLRLRATGEAGPAAFSVTQRFVDGRTVTWPAQLDVTPGAVGHSGNSYGIALAAAAAGLLVAASAVLLWLLRRRSRPLLQEK